MADGIFVQPLSSVAIEHDEVKDSTIPENAALLALLAAQDLPRSAANMVERYDSNFVSVRTIPIDPVQLCIGAQILVIKELRAASLCLR